MEEVMTTILERIQNITPDDKFVYYTGGSIQKNKDATPVRQAAYEAYEVHDRAVLYTKLIDRVAGESKFEYWIRGVEQGSAKRNEVYKALRREYVK